MAKMFSLLVSVFCFVSELDEDLSRTLICCHNLTRLTNTGAYVLKSLFTLQLHSLSSILSLDTSQRLVSIKAWLCQIALLFLQSSQFQQDRRHTPTAFTALIPDIWYLVYHLVWLGNHTLCFSTNIPLRYSH